MSGQISWRLDSGSITVPSEYAPLRFWRNTDVAALTSGQVTLANTLGYEWDPEYPEYADSYPAGRVLLSTTNVTSFAGPEQHHLSPPHVLLRAIAIGDDRCQPRTIRRSHEQAKMPSHPDIIAPASRKGNLMLRTIH